MIGPYMTATDELTNRILKLIPDHPEIMALESPFDLFKVAGFDCKDLDPSLMQASFALSNARALYKQQETTHAPKS